MILGLPVIVAILYPVFQLYMHISIENRQHTDSTNVSILFVIVFWLFLQSL
jgi:hypothetical protein